MKKTALSLLLLVNFLAYGNAADNIGRSVYSVYNENFNGVKIDWFDWTNPDPSSRDNCRLFSWNGSNSIAPVDTFDENHKIDGKNFWRMTNTSSTQWFGWGVCFTDSSSVARSNNMQAYASGGLLFYARSSNASTKNMKAGIGFLSGTNLTNTLGNLGFQANGQRERIYVPFSSLGVTQANLAEVSYTFLVIGEGSSVPTGTLDIDMVMWRSETAGSFNVDLKNISNNTAASEITWSDLTLPKRWTAADQYIELDLDMQLKDAARKYNTWGIQIYTDIKNPSSDPVYSGELTADMASGMVSEGSADMIIPMCWRISDRLLPYSGSNTGDDYDRTLKIGFNEGGLFDLGAYEAGDADASSYYTWFAMKDKAMLGLNEFIYNGADYLRAWDTRGYHAASGENNYWGMMPGMSPDGMIKPKIYLGADFGPAVIPMSYKVDSITIELFYE